MSDHNQFSRRKFIRAASLVGAVAGIKPGAVFGAETSFVATDSNANMRCKPYLQALYTNGVTIRWVTGPRCFSWIEYGENADKLDQRAYHVIDGLVQANNTINEIAIKNLKPGTGYYYKAVSKKIDKFNAGKVSYAETVSSEVYRFTTQHLKVSEVKFAVFNDVHDRPETFAHLLKYQQQGRKDFMLLNGDIFSSLKGGEAQIIDHLLNPVTELFATQTPFIYSRGNHEARGEFARQLPEYITGREHKFYYSFQMGPMYAIMLDTGEDKADSDPAYGGIIDFDSYRAEQTEWLQKEIQKDTFKKARYRVVINHIPPFYTANKDAHGTVYCSKFWVPILNKAKIDVMICGHTHRYKVKLPDPALHRFPIVIGGGPMDGERTIIEVSVSDKALNLLMTDDAGKVVGKLSI